MKTTLFALPGNELLTKSLAAITGCELGELELRNFPDGETYIRVHAEVKGRKVIIVSTLNNPDAKLLPLWFLSQTVKELGANNVCLVAPYLAYMRQDKQFNPGEGVTSSYFAKLISAFADELITIDPHLHRRHSMSEIYTIPCQVLHAAPLISSWIKKNVVKPVLVGPDVESEQWVSAVAKDAGAPFIVLEKIRRGDSDVQVTVPQVETYKECTPVLVDDIISTARTMIETVGHLKKTDLRAPICIGVHAVFAAQSFQELMKAGSQRIVTTNSIQHESNGIEIVTILANALSASSNMSC